MEFRSGNIFVRTAGALPAGYVVQNHQHLFDHTTYVVRGAFRIDRLNLEGEVERSVVIRAGEERTWILIKAGVNHRLEALEDGSIYHCIYSHRTAQGEVVQEWSGWDATD